MTFTGNPPAKPLPPYLQSHVCPVCGKIADPFKGGHDPDCGYGRPAPGRKK